MTILRSAQYNETRAAKPSSEASKRVCIEKSDGKKRPLGFPSLEDKIVSAPLCGTVIDASTKRDCVRLSYFCPTQ